MHDQGIELVEPSDLGGSLRGRHNLYNHLELTMKNAKESIVLQTTTQGLIRKVEGLKPTFEKLKKRGVNIRIAAPLTKETKAAVKELNGIAEIKNSNTKGRFCIVDGKEVVFMLLDDDKVHPSYDIGVWVNTPYFVSTLDNFFGTAWKEMTPLSKVKL